MKRDRNGHSNHQKVMKQVTMYKIPHTHVTTEAMTTAHSYLYNFIHQVVDA